MTEEKNEDHHVRLKRVEYEIAELREHTQRIPALEVALVHVQSSLDRLVDRESKPFPIWNLVSAVGVVSVIIAGYATLITQPIDNRSRRNMDYFTAHVERAADIEAIRAARDSSFDARIQNLERDMETQKDSTRMADKLEGRVDAIEKQVESIDNGGSRIWNKSPSPNGE